ncbi:zinc knuckle CX2CX4HX4C containing protein [Tanacetum coccineum]
MENNNSSPQNSVEVIDGAASVQRKTANSFDSVLQTKPHKQVVKIMELRNNDVVDGANVAITMEAVEVSSRFANTLYGYFIGKRLAFPLFDSKDGMESFIENGSWLIRLMPLFLNIWTPNTVLKKDVIKQAPVWVKLHHVPTVAYSEVESSLITTQIELKAKDKKPSDKGLLFSMAKINSHLPNMMQTSTFSLLEISNDNEAARSRDRGSYLRNMRVEITEGIFFLFALGGADLDWESNG